MLPEPQLDDPWGLDSKTPVRQAVSIETAAQKEEEERERARLTELAKTKTKKADDKSSYLDPLDDPAGPFADRVQKTDTERDLVRQASYVEVSQKKYDNFPVYDWEKEEKKGFDWEMLDPVNFFTKVRDWVGLGPDEKKAIAAMKKGREIIDPISRDLSDKQKCLAAAKEFWTAAWRWPDSVLEEDALHLAGECYYFAGDYPNAMKCYQKLIIKYQHSPHLDTDVRRLFAIGRYWEKEALRGVSSINMSEKSRPTFDTFGWAKKAYETIFINDPNGPISDDAVMALAEAYLKRGKYQGDDNYDQAAYYFKYLRENFPLSKHVAKAHELELHSRTSAYMGAEYNSKTLDEAGKLAEVTLRQFGNELGEDKDEVVAIKEGVVQRQAEREWVLGQHYDKKKYYGSARIYYEKLIDQYPQTAYAEKARKRLDEISDKPAQPSKFEFIQKAFTAR